MSDNSIVFHPIGVIHSPHKEPTGAPIQGAYAMNVEGRVEVYEPYREGLADLEGFSHAILLYFFNRTKGYKLRVKPYLDNELRGLFATRAPRRPNNIGLTVARVLEVTGSGMRIAGVDMLDQTPLLDIKPYVPLFDEGDKPSFGWLEKHLKDGKRKPPEADGRFHGK